MFRELMINFDTIQYAFCHRKLVYMINQKFMKLCTLQDHNMEMCKLVGYPGPLRFTPAHIHIRILPCTKLHELLINHVGEFVMTKCILNCLKMYQCHHKFSYMINQKFMQLCTW
jgi:hypothetical protein